MLDDSIVVDVEQANELQVFSTHDAAAFSWQQAYHTDYSCSIEQSYFRTKLPQLHESHNIVLTLTDSLLTLVPRLALTPHDSSAVIKLHERLIHELHALAHQLETHEYSKQYQFLAHYVLCTFIDNMLLRSSFHDEWQQHCLVGSFVLQQHSLTQQDPLLFLAEKLSKRPKKYIELLELIYLCLTLGYQPKQGKAQHARTHLFRIVYYQQGQNQETKNTDVLKPKQLSKRNAHLLWWGIGLILLLSSLFYLYNYTLLINIVPLKQTIQLIDQEVQNNHEDL